LFGLIIILIELNFIKESNINKVEISGDTVSVGWNANTEDELKKINQAYLINFTAAWCITCQANDKLALSRPIVKKYLAENNIEYIVADWTNRDDNILKVLKEYGRNGVPLYLYWKPGLEETVILPAILTEDILINSL
jgi:thiol:disulfide interchange protein DsbD